MKTCAIFGDSQMRRLRQARPQQFKVEDAISYTEPGLSIQGLAKKLQQTPRPRSNDATAAVVMIGTNDLKRSNQWPTVRDFMRNVSGPLLRVLRPVAERFRNVLVLMPPPVLLHAERTDSHRVAWALLQKLLRGKCQKYGNITFGNLGEQFWGRPDLYEPRYHGGRVDKVHWNREGIRLATDYISSWLYQL